MFTGIIEEVGEITEAVEGLLRISAPLILEDAKLGDSIAINGVDLTVTHIEAAEFLANLMPETYRRSNWGDCRWAPESIWNARCGRWIGCRDIWCAASSRAAGRSAPPAKRRKRSSSPTTPLPICCAT